MIRLPNIPLPEETQNGLKAYQSEVDACKTYAERVAKAKAQWSKYNHKGNVVFDSVKERLDAMCSGVRRCGYCEDSVADEVEHIYPKNLYPNRAFLWENYLYACGPCNSPKSNKFAIRDSAGNKIDLTRQDTPPPAGEPLLIDPRNEDPTDFLTLDLSGDCYFAPTADTGSEERERANYTIQTLHLNDRANLPRARQSARYFYKCCLRDYIRVRDGGGTASALERIKREIFELSHISVWREMQRQYLLHDELKALFGEAPEALAW